MWVSLTRQRPYLLSSHVDEQLRAIGAEGNIGGNQHSQTAVIVRQLHRQVTCQEEHNGRRMRLQSQGQCKDSQIGNLATR